MKTTKLLLPIIAFIFIAISLNAQKSRNDNFYIDGEKFQKPIKYILFNPKTDHKVGNGTKIYFHFENESFQFQRNMQRLDTCDIDYFQKIKFENADKLSQSEYLFVQEILEKKNLIEFRALYLDPQIEFHPYFKIFIIEKKDNVVIQYEVSWDYIGSRGLKEERPK